MIKASGTQIPALFHDANREGDKKVLRYNDDIGKARNLSTKVGKPMRKVIGRAIEVFLADPHTLLRFFDRWAHF
ncbi:hypothetical protein AS19_21870 [Alcanivorax sp. NBRC 101098]|nr:hypothetical protein AS19_21870 [Alcanivorax sp. NBRC 101098]